MARATGPADRYSTGAIWFHWVIALLVLFNLVVGIFHEGVPALKALMGTHKAVGITVLALTLGRIAWRLGHQPPPLPAELAGWERTAAKAARWAFYALLLIMPLTGWAMVSAGDPPRPLGWFGLFDVPLLPVTKPTAGVAHDLHEVLGLLFAGLVLLHVAGALRHHLLLKDGVLARMIPGITSKR
ncbi:cytochrome b [Hephaestia sp. GCM10023244]|uniref:cytochrome b n=1 Tax=unclassified Hephaestia TaxID=2631281 RepID=UPI0020778A68|nr:cytochrome b [Hephaestia sp. MAHUQ-44]MCM8730582.1 cytochrome b [Hephaestia sp. MAHUQ-44]